MHPLELIAGPCVIEGRDHTLQLAEAIKKTCQELDVSLIFKASFDKANRTSAGAYRGIGMDQGLAILDDVARKLELPVLTDIHEPWQAEPVAQVATVLQIPAFLCRQTDLLAAAARTGRAINVKKGQFLAPDEMTHVVTKLRGHGAEEIYLTERGSCFGYHQLVVDFRSLPQMQNLAAKVIFDATHSVQLPGALDGASGGQREYVAPLARAAVAVGVDGLFLEVHQDPLQAPSDGANMVRLDALKPLLQQVIALHHCRWQMS